MNNDRPDYGSMVEPMMKLPDEPVSPDFEERGTPAMVTALYAALATAQGEFGEIKKTSEVKVRMRDGGSYNFKYAPLEEMFAATKPALSKHGLTVMMPFIRTMQNVTKQILIIAHKDGGRLVFTFPFDPEKDIKTFGGQTTYYQRYAYRSALSLAADADMDEMPEEKRGEHSAESNTRPKQQRNNGPIGNEDTSRPLDRQQSLPGNQQPQRTANSPSSSASVEKPSQAPQSQSRPQPSVSTQPVREVGDTKQLITDLKEAAKAIGVLTVRDLSNEIFGILWNGEVRPLGEPFLSAMKADELSKVIEAFVKRRAGMSK